jgi:hypothetical protein
VTSLQQTVRHLWHRLRPASATATPDAATATATAAAATTAAADRVVSTALVVTDRPDRYGKQLASHMSKRITTSWDEAARTGALDFGRGRADLTCVDGGLQLVLGGGAADLAGLEDAVGRHLVRFGARDELVVTWVHQDGTPGTVQRKLED